MLIGEISKEQFDMYESVRESGVTNMFAVSTVSELSGLDKNIILAIMKNYGSLREQYGATGA